jgi:hypothetical protein
LIFAIGTLFGATLAFLVNAIIRKKADEQLARRREEIERIAKAAL